VLDERYLTTLAAAVVEAIQSSCPELDASQLRIDLDARVQSQRIALIHISEDEPGGLGVVEALVDRYVGIRATSGRSSRLPWPL